MLSGRDDDCTGNSMQMRRTVFYVTILELDLLQLANDSSSVFLRRCLATNVTSDGLALSDRLHNIVSLCGTLQNRRTHRKRCMLYLVGVFIEVHVPVTNMSKVQAEPSRRLT